MAKHQDDYQIRAGETEQEYLSRLRTKVPDEVWRQIHRQHIRICSTFVDQGKPLTQELRIGNAYVLMLVARFRLLGLRFPVQ